MGWFYRLKKTYNADDGGVELDVGEATKLSGLTDE